MLFVYKAKLYLTNDDTTQFVTYIHWAHTQLGLCLFLYLAGQHDDDD